MSGSPDGGGRDRSAGVVIALAVVLLLLAGAALATGFVLRHGRGLDADRAAAVRAARQEALNLTSIDSRNLDAALARVVAGATGTFRDELLSRQATLRDVVPANKVLAEGVVVEAALVRGDADTATVLVAVDATIRNVKVPDGRTNPYRMRLDLERHGGRWLTSSLQFVG